VYPQHLQIIVMVEEYKCHQCKWKTIIPSQPPRQRFSNILICYMCFTREHYYLLREHHPKSYRAIELNADRRYRVMKTDPSITLCPIRDLNHWSYVYKNYVDRIFRNFDKLNLDVMSRVTDMLIGMY